MTQRKLATWAGTLLGLLGALLGALLAAQAHGAEPLQEEFHKTYTVNANATLSLENINGAARITAWDKNEIKVDAVKTAWSQERLDEARISVEADAAMVAIRTEYRGHEHNFNSGDRDNPASVEYTLTVPRGARLDEIKLINGALDISGVVGEVHASCINGRLTVEKLAGRAELSTINGPLDAQFEQLSKANSIELSSVNGPLQLTLPSAVGAEVEASTVHGPISNDFGLHVHNRQFVGHDMHAKIGEGGAHIQLNNVNGPISVRHAGDGHSVSTGHDLDSDDGDEI
jgi:DUF4097 and DUF4098 domain-containing protein YvlB